MERGAPLYLNGNSDPPCLSYCCICCCVTPFGCCCPKVPKPDEMTHPTEADIAAQGTKCCKAADGRLIEYSVHGSTKADARVIVTGYYAIPSSLQHPGLEALERLNIREINISTPGYGWSTLAPRYKVNEWPKTDVEPVFAAEGFTGPFFASGASAGCIHAMALAQHFGDRVLKIGLRAPFLPLHVTKQLKLKNYALYPTTAQVLKNINMVRCCKWQTGKFAEMQPKERKEPMKWPAAALKAFPARMQFADRITARTMFHGHYGVNASSYVWARDVLTDVPGLDVLKLKDNGFKGQNKVVIWYGLDDEDCPPEHGKWLAEHLEATTRTIAGYGHVGVAALVDWDDYYIELTRTTGKPAALAPFTAAAQSFQR